MLKNIIIIGNSGNSLSIINTLFSINKIKKKFKILGILDDINNKPYSGIKVIGNIKKHNIISDSYYINGIASINSLSAKNNIIKKFVKNGAKFISIFDPSSIISQEIKIEEGVYIGAHTFVGAKTVIEKHTLILQNVTISHNVKIQPYVTISSNTSILGHVKIGKGSFIGSTCSINPYTVIEDNVLLGTGSNVFGKLKSKSIYYGNKARFIRKNNYL
jgi:sugar O-acyltransferase (sialic acid O-acetyltransferase NeuD family)